MPPVDGSHPPDYKNRNEDELSDQEQPITDQETMVRAGQFQTGPRCSPI